VPLLARQIVSPSASQTLKPQRPSSPSKHAPAEKKKPSPVKQTSAKQSPPANQQMMSINEKANTLGKRSPAQNDLSNVNVSTLANAG